MVVSARSRKLRSRTNWRPNLLKLAEFAEIRIIHCTAPQQVLHDRITDRAERDAHRRAHNDGGLLAEIAAGTRTAASFVSVNMDVGQLTVDTTDGYRPGLEVIAEFVGGPGSRGLA